MQSIQTKVTNTTSRMDPPLNMFHWRSQAIILAYRSNLYSLPSVWALSYLSLLILFFLRKNGFLPAIFPHRPILISLLQIVDGSTCHPDEAELDPCWATSSFSNKLWEAGHRIFKVFLAYFTMTSTDSSNCFTPNTKSLLSTWSRFDFDVYKTSIHFDMKWPGSRQVKLTPSS